LREVIRVPQWFEHVSKTENRREINHTLLESKIQAIPIEGVRGDDVFKHVLLQRLDRFELGLSPCQQPILHQIGAVQPRPLRHQSRKHGGKDPLSGVPTSRLQ
jgi:hypothetical protein